MHDSPSATRRTRLGGLIALGAASVALATMPTFCRTQPAENIDPNYVDRTAPVPMPPVPGAVALLGKDEGDLAKNWAKYNDVNQPAPWRWENGVITAGGGDVMTKERYRDFQAHVEFKEPYFPDRHGQERGNSGVYLQGRYELQVLDSYGVPDPGKGDCGAIYNTAAPLVKAYRPPLRWQTYDITFRAPRYDAAGAKTEPARVTVFLNGICVQNNTIIPGPTGGAMDNKEDQPGALRLQDHGNPVQYRNIWIAALPEKGAEHY